MYVVCMNYFISLYSFLLVEVKCCLYEFYIKYIKCTEETIITIGFWLWCLMFSFIHIFLVTMDVWSRFQNYKRVKDHLFQHGFTPKIAEHYRGSKCQRMALVAAAKELGMETEIKQYYSSLGVKWYHFVPQFMIHDPLFPFKKYFWSRTFLEKYYEPKFEFRNPKKLTA